MNRGVWIGQAGHVKMAGDRSRSDCFDGVDGRLALIGGFAQERATASVISWPLYATAIVSAKPSS
jgi:hypothetical protein